MINTTNNMLNIPEYSLDDLLNDYRNQKREIYDWGSIKAVGREYPKQERQSHGLDKTNK